MSNWITSYTVMSEEMDYSIFPFFLIMIVVTVVIFYFNYKITKIHKVFLILNTFAFLLALSVPIGKTAQYLLNKKTVLNLIDQNKILVVQGNIESFHPMSKAGHEYERFFLEGELFQYSDFVEGYFFNNSSTYGGPIRFSGQEVRLTYYSKNGENYIIKVETK